MSELTNDQEGIAKMNLVNLDLIHYFVQILQNTVTEHLLM